MTNPNCPDPTHPPADPELRDTIAAITRRKIDGTWWRQNDPRHPLTSIAPTVLADSRWRQRGDVGVLHLSDSPDAAWAELHRSIGPEMDPTLIARRFGSVTAHLKAVLDLTQHAIAADLLCGDEELLGPHGPRCPAIARAADDAGFDGILAPSAAMPGAHTLVVFRRAALHLTVRDVDPEVYGPPRQPKR